MKNNWKPILRGKIYCSPRCGMGCTTRMYRLAVKRSQALAKRLGKGWKTEVWENLGWHYCVKKGKLEITGYHNFRRRSYLIMFNTKPQIILSDAHDPVAGVKQVLKEAFKIARTFESEIALVKG